jgi:hypothetical protein
MVSGASKKIKNPGSRKKFIQDPDPGSRVLKNTGSQIRIRNTFNIFINRTGTENFEPTI